MTDITFICCIESGGLEEMTVRMITSLRRWGGRYKDAKVIAVYPRIGPPLTKQTLDALKRLNVIYLSDNVNTEAWFKFLNKPHALFHAEAHVHTDYACWLDSDVIFLDEPFQTITDFNKDVYACASDKNIGSTGVNDKFDPYWSKLCESINLDVNSMPWIKTEIDSELIRLYFNSGVFAYRKQSQFAERYLETCKKLLKSKISNQESGIYFTDQVSLGLTICIEGMSYEALPLADNYPINRKKANLGQQIIGPVSILHFHDMMWGQNWEAFLKLLDGYQPQLDWLNQIGPLKNPASQFGKLTRHILNKYRDLKLKSYQKNCNVVC